MTKVTFYIQGKLTPKERPRFNTKTKKVYTPSKTTSSESDIVRSFLSVSPAHTLWLGAIKATIIHGYGVPQSASQKQQSRLLKKMYAPLGADTDNIQKTIYDALNGVAYKDDRQICVVDFKKIYSAEHYVEVTLEEL